MDDVTIVRRSWAVIEAWLDDHHEEGTELLNPPATAADLDAVEATIGAELPASFRECYRRHNGQCGDTPLLRRYWMLSTDEIEREWELMASLLEDGAFDDRITKCTPRLRPIDEVIDETIAEVWWSTNWIPFGRDPGGHLLCLDLDPVEPPGEDTAEADQVITFWNDTATRGVEGAPFSAWFEGLARKLQTGEYVYATWFHPLMVPQSEIEHQPPQSSDGPISQTPQSLFDLHYDRLAVDEPDRGNWFLEAVFEYADEVRPYVQYQWGLCNLTGLDDDAFDSAATLLADHDCTIVDRGPQYLTATSEGLADRRRQPADRILETVWADRGRQLVDQILETVYDVSIETVELRERNL